MKKRSARTPVKIDLMKKGRPTLASTVMNATDKRRLPPRSGMTIDELKKNYNAIIQARALYYPVAFQFLRELGRGRQGIVFLGLRQGARGCITTHAIKVFDPEIYRGPEEYWTDMGRIAAQISRLQRVQSPNLVSRHSYEETYGIGYVQMEAIDGIDLRHLLSKDHLAMARKKSTPEEWARFSEKIFRIDGDRMCLQPGVVVYILRGLLRGVECLHEMNFLHSDIKPANIMIDRLGYVKVVDFGRAVIVGEKLTFLLGSPMYMAPETHRGEAGGMRSDFFGVGLVGLEMLRGERLTEADNVDEDELMELKMDLANRLPDLLPEHVLENDSLVSIMKRFLEPDPEKRYSSAKEAEVGGEGLREVDKKFAQAGIDTEYARELSDYLMKLVDDKTDRIEAQNDSTSAGRSDAI